MNDIQSYLSEHTMTEKVSRNNAVIWRNLEWNF